MALLPRTSQGDYLGYDYANYLVGSLDFYKDVSHFALVYQDQINVYEADLNATTPPPGSGGSPAVPANTTYIGHVEFDNVVDGGYTGDRLADVTGVEGRVVQHKNVRFVYKVISMLQKHDQYEFKLDIKDTHGDTHTILFRQIGVMSQSADKYDTEKKGVSPAKGSPGPNVVRDLTGALVLAETFIHDADDAASASTTTTTTNTPLLLGVALLVVAVGFYGMQGKKRR